MVGKMTFKNAKKYYIFGCNWERSARSDNLYILCRKRTKRTKNAKNSTKFDFDFDFFFNFCFDKFSPKSRPTHQFFLTLGYFDRHQLGF
jgi:hypothetical protein